MLQGILPNGRQQFFNSNGLPLAAGTVGYYIPNTLTAKTTYLDDGGVNANTNPVVLDANGTCIAYGTGSYRQQVKDVNGNLIWDVQVDAPATQSDLSTFETTLAGSTGASLVGYLEGASGSVKYTVQAKLQQTVSILDFGAFSTTVSGYGSFDSTTAIQSALNSLSTNGGALYIPTGTYLISSPLLVASNVNIYGDGYNQSILQCNLDIEVLYTSRATAGTTCEGIVLMDFQIFKNLETTTQFDIHLYNPVNCNLIRVMTKSARGDTTLYPATDVSGIWLDRPSSGGANGYINLLEDCWCHHSCLWLNNQTDSQIRGGWYWGMTTPYAIRLTSCGDIDISGVMGIITSSYNGGIWLDGSSTNQIRIIGNEWDGNPALTQGQKGDGIYCPQEALVVSIIGNNIWGCAKNGINITDPVGWTITGNNFWKNNGNNNYYDDIRITGSTFQPNGNIVSSNVFQNEVSSTTNLGYAIHEINGGQYPINNIYVNNTIPGGSYYKTPGILVQAYANLIANYGNSMQNQNWLLGSSLISGWSGNGANQVSVNNGNSSLASGGQLNLPIAPTFGINGAIGGSGILCITTTRVNYNVQSTRTIYFVNYYGNTSVITSAATQNGSGGGNSFTLSLSSPGTVTYNDTSGNVTDVRMSFVGSLSLN